jgi:hypothetical protein
MMNAHKIVWQWCCQSISAPDRETQNYLQTVAMGVILAHQGNNLSPLENSRIEDKTSTRSFSPDDEPSELEGMDFKTVKDLIFDRLFEEMMVHVEIHYCWNSYSLPDITGAVKEHDNGAHYQVCIGEILASTV